MISSDAGGYASFRSGESAHLDRFRHQASALVVQTQPSSETVAARPYLPVTSDEQRMKFACRYLNETVFVKKY